MYRFSRQIFIEIKDAVDPSPDTISKAEARRRVLQACEGTVERLARDARYFPKPARSLFQEIERSGEGVVAPCRATTRKGKPCQRTPLPGREYCPSHSHLEEHALAS
jgi:hypothetical protein